MLWAAFLIFILIGAYVQGKQDFEKRVGGEIQKAAPVARKVIPQPAKSVLREGRELLPIYGPTGQWLARKGASVVYFGVVGLFVLAMRRRKAVTLGQILLVTVTSGVVMSAIVELLQLPEELTNQIFDLACGAVGGLISGFLASWWLRKQPPIGGT